MFFFFFTQYNYLMQNNYFDVIMANSYGRFLVNFLRNWQTDFQNVQYILHFIQ